MIELLPDVPDDLVGVRAGGTLTVDDYQRVVGPLVDELTRDGRRRRWLVEVAPDFHGLTPGAVREDVRQGLRALRAFGGCAVVTDVPWVRTATRAAAQVMPYPMRVFGEHERAAAIAWLTALPDAGTLVARLDHDTGVLVVEVTDALRVEDLDRLARVVDSWLSEHPSLPGIVVHARAFPGWARVGALIRHIGVVARRQRRIERVAVAVGGRIAPRAAALVRRIAHPQIRTFGEEELDAAVLWAGAGRRA